MRKGFKRLRNLATKAQRHKEFYFLFLKNEITLGVFVSLWLILFLEVIPAFAQPEIEKILKANHCPECHYFNPQKPNKSKAKKAPDLFYAGEKFQKKWLIEFLIKPETIRPSGYITDPGYLKGNPELKSHIKLFRKDALLVSEYLLTLKSGLLEPVKISDGPGKSRLFRAKQLVERKYGCTACHKTQNLMGMIKGGSSGPSLSNAGNRLRGEWIFNMLKNPVLFEKNGRMPIYKIPDEEILLIAEYLISLVKENKKK